MFKLLRTTKRRFQSNARLDTGKKYMIPGIDGIDASTDQEKSNWVVQKNSYSKTKCWFAPPKSTKTPSISCSFRWDHAGVTTPWTLAMNLTTGCRLMGSKDGIPSRSFWDWWIRGAIGSVFFPNVEKMLRLLHPFFTWDWTTSTFERLQCFSFICKLEADPSGSVFSQFRHTLVYSSQNGWSFPWEGSTDVLKLSCWLVFPHLGITLPRNCWKTTPGA